MPVEALVLALGAAVLHAAWNAFLARSRDVFAATAVVLGLSVVLFAPVAAATWRLEAEEAVPWIATSAALEIVYFALLATAYRRSDLSLVYPVARGAAPVFILAGAALTGATLGAWQAVGVILVGGGVFLVRGTSGTADRRGVALALAIAVTIAGYTLADKQGIEHASPTAYLELVLVPAAIAAIAWHAVTGRVDALRRELSAAAVAAAICSFAAYTLVLGALSLAPAPAVAAVRETSVLFAVALGAFVLRERVGGARAGGAALVVAGVALVALG